MRVAAVPIALDALVTLAGSSASCSCCSGSSPCPARPPAGEIGLWLALAGTLGIVVSATISMRDERLSPSGSYTDATGGRWRRRPRSSCCPRRRRRTARDARARHGAPRRSSPVRGPRSSPSGRTRSPVKVLSTPGMIAMMERCASSRSRAFEHCPTGTPPWAFEVCVKHVGAAAEGALCAVTARLDEVVDGRKLRFAVEVTEAESAPSEWAPTSGAWWTARPSAADRAARRPGTYNRRHDRPRAGDARGPPGAAAPHRRGDRRDGGGAAEDPRPHREDGVARPGGGGAHLARGPARERAARGRAPAEPPRGARARAGARPAAGRLRRAQPGRT